MFSYVNHLQFVMSDGGIRNVCHKAALPMLHGIYAPVYADCATLLRERERERERETEREREIQSQNDIAS